MGAIRKQISRLEHVFFYFFFSNCQNDFIWRDTWATKLSSAPVPNCHHRLFGLAWWFIHVRFEITQFGDMCIFIQTMDHQFPRPKLLQIKCEPNWASCFNLSWKEKLFGSVDRQQITMDSCLSYKHPYCLRLWWAKRHKICTGLHAEYFYKVLRLYSRTSLILTI